MGIAIAAAADRAARKCTSSAVSGKSNLYRASPGPKGRKGVGTTHNRVSIRGCTIPARMIISPWMSGSTVFSVKAAPWSSSSIRRVLCSDFNERHHGGMCRGRTRRLTRRCEGQDPLRAIAYVCSSSAGDDAVQEAWIRLSAPERRRRELGGWLNRSWRGCPEHCARSRAAEEYFEETWKRECQTRCRLRRRGRSEKSALADSGLALTRGARDAHPGRAVAFVYTTCWDAVRGDLTISHARPPQRDSDASGRDAGCGSAPSQMPNPIRGEVVETFMPRARW